MANNEDKLRRTLFRITCPDSRQLGEFHLGLLPEAEAAAVQAHLAHCPHCSLEIQGLERYLTELEPDLSYTISERIKIWIADRITPEASSSTVGMPAFAVRGDSQGPLMYEAGDYQLTIDVQEDAQHPGRQVIIGLLLGENTAEFDVNLWQAGQLITTTAVDDLGNFVLNQVQPGTYELILTAAEAEIHVQELLI